MVKRTLTGIVITAVVYFVIAFSHISELLLCAVAMLNAAAVVEIFYATGRKEKTILKYTCAIGAAVLTFFPIPKYGILLWILLPAAVMLFGWMMHRQERCSFDQSYKTILLALIVAMLFKAIPILRQVPNGQYYLAMGITLCFTTDVTAYLVGSKFGRHKMLIKVSPNKTWEGSVAGIVASILVMMLFGLWWESGGHGQCRYAVLYAITASAVGQFGDLSMSVVKRIGGVKDFGHFLPGHGGILDRFDSHLFCIAYTLLFCIFTGGYLV